MSKSQDRGELRVRMIDIDIKIAVLEHERDELEAEYWRVDEPMEVNGEL
jgi:hypothetical protein